MFPKAMLTRPLSTVRLALRRRGVSQVRKVSLVELGTHVEVAIAIGGWQDGEQTLARQLWDSIPSDALLTEDRGFFSYEDWKALDLRGVKLLVRLKSNLILKPIQRLPDGSYLAKIYPSSYARDKDRDGIVVRSSNTHWTMRSAPAMGKHTG